MLQGASSSMCADGRGVLPDAIEPVNGLGVEGALALAAVLPKTQLRQLDLSRSCDRTLKARTCVSQCG